MTFTPTFLELVLGILAALVGVLAVHECGHAIVAAALGARDMKVRVNVLGLSASVQATFSTRRRVLFFLLAGPLANLVLACVLVPQGGIFSLVGVLSLILCGTSLLPRGDSDGARAMALWKRGR